MRTHLQHDNSGIKVLIFGHREFSQLMTTVIPDLVDQAEFKVQDAIVGSIAEVQQYVDSERPDVIVSAGANAAYLKSALELPVLSLSNTDQDLIHAVKRAAKAANRIVLIHFGGPSPVVPLLEATLGVAIIEETYRTSDQARELFHQHRKDTDTAVVSASLVCGLAAQQGMPSFLLYSLDSCRRCLAKRLKLHANTKR